MNNFIFNQLSSKLSRTYTRATVNPIPPVGSQVYSTKQLAEYRSKEASNGFQM